LHQSTKLEEILIGPRDTEVNHGLYLVNIDRAAFGKGSVDGAGAHSRNESLFVFKPTLLNLL
jgi:hypothetical protein